MKVETPEQREARLARQRERNAAQKAARTPEQHAEHLARRRVAYARKMGTTPEQRAAEKEKRRAESDADKRAARERAKAETVARRARASAEKAKANAKAKAERKSARDRARLAEQRAKAASERVRMRERERTIAEREARVRERERRLLPATSSHAVANFDTAAQAILSTATADALNSCHPAELTAWVERIADAVVDTSTLARQALHATEIEDLIEIFTALSAAHKRLGREVQSSGVPDRHGNFCEALPSSVALRSLSALAGVMIGQLSAQSAVK